eukprot:TRINITY_DN5806_c4_g1_i1.p1 TRINITY_DN5806_c4_g1~~TRINITY_DN5806_c4_g1_i1.p1  ORF type:complete len:749 (+),score=262.95 TRINITY_DN5806_c4_g1_i1:126-2372(+)
MQAMSSPERCSQDDQAPQLMMGDATPPREGRSLDAMSSPDAVPPREQAGGDATGARSLSVDAPAFRPGPHTVTIYCPTDSRAEKVPCDLATLRIGDLVLYAANHFGLPQEDCCLTFAGLPMTDLGAKAIDIGVSNQSVVMLQPKGTDVTVPDPMVMPQVDIQPLGSPQSLEEQLRMQQQQMMQYNAALQANHQAQLQLAAMAGIPLVPLQPPAPELSHERGDVSPDGMYREHPMRHQVPQGHGGVPQMPSAAHMRVRSMGATPPLGTPPPRGMSGMSPGQGQTITRVIIAQPPPNLGGHGHHTPDQRQRSVPSSRPCGSINLSAIAGDFCSYALTNEGSRALISALEPLEPVNPIIDQILREVPAQFATLATHQHGSKVLRSLNRKLNQTQAASLLRLPTKDIVELAESTSGTDVLTELIAKAGDSPAAGHFCCSMAPGILQICTSVNARKVLLACLQHFPPNAVEPLYDEIGHQLLNAATDQCGCITLQRVLDFTHNIKWKTQLQMQVLEATMYLITDPYGNYVLQHAVKDDPCCARIVAEKLSGQLVDYACNKFASNVIERCLSGPDETRDMLIEEVISPHTLSVLMQDAYGNFVVQSSVENAPAHLLDRVRKAVEPIVARSPYGYRIESKLHRRLKRHGGASGAPQPRRSHNMGGSMGRTHGMPMMDPQGGSRHILQQVHMNPGHMSSGMGMGKPGMHHQQMHQQQQSMHPQQMHMQPGVPFAQRTPQGMRVPAPGDSGMGMPCM